MDDGRLQGQLNQIKGMIASLMKAGGSTSSSGLPSVDFCCDMFDRKDSGVLSGYWDTPAPWSLRGNQVVQQTNSSSTNTYTIASVGSSTVAGGSYTEIVKCVLPNPGYDYFFTGNRNVFSAANMSPNLYSANLNSPDLNIKIGFNISNEMKQTTAAPLPDISYDDRVLPSSIGAVFGDSASRLYGALANSATLPSITAPAMTDIYGNAAPGASISSRTVFTGGLTDFATTTAYAPQSCITPSVSTTYPDPRAGLGYMGSSNLTMSSTFNLNPLVPGYNTLKLQATGNNYSMYLNDVLVVSSTNIQLLPRTRVGITGVTMNLLAFISNSGFAYKGISQFKAWPVTSPEPPDQSGHGTIKDGVLTYTDKYHSSSGYNPLA